MSTRYGHWVRAVWGLLFVCALVGSGRSVFAASNPSISTVATSAGPQALPAPSTIRSGSVSVSVSTSSVLSTSIPVIAPRSTLTLGSAGATVKTLIPAKTVPDIVVVRGIARLTSERVLAEGAFRFSPPDPKTRPHTSESTARQLANRGIDQGAKLPAEVFFGLFTTASPAKRGVDGLVRPIFCRRPVWVVRYPIVPGKRQSGVVVPRSNKTATTLDLSVTTEIVVIVDDASGDEVRRSEYRPATLPATPTTPVSCPPPEPKPTTTTRSTAKATETSRAQTTIRAQTTLPAPERFP